MSAKPDQNNSVDDHLNAMEEISDDISDIKWMDIPVIIILVSLICLVIIQTVLRSLGQSISWSDEVARILVIFFGFIGSITCVRKGSHIFLEFFYRYIPAHWIKPLIMTTETIAAAFWGYLGYWNFQLAQRIPSNYATIPVPKAVVYWVVGTACVLMVVTGIWRVMHLRKTYAAEIAERVM